VQERIKMYWWSDYHVLAYCGQRYISSVVTYLYLLAVFQASVDKILVVLHIQYGMSQLKKSTARRQRKSALQRSYFSYEKWM
jgi:hypothetical protein